MNYCLRFLYQSSSKSYEQILNKKNCEGDTPLLVACSNKSNDVIRILFEFGGADIFVLNANKLTAYQIALTSCNEIGLQMLMKY
jgi:ankyrin repeat protein